MCGFVVLETNVMYQLFSKKCLEFFVVITAAFSASRSCCCYLHGCDRCFRKVAENQQSYEGILRTC